MERPLGRFLFLALLCFAITCTKDGSTPKEEADSSVNAKENLIRQAESMLDAHASGRGEQFARFIIPEIVEKAGGIDALTRTVDLMRQDLQRRGFRILECEIVGSPSIHDSGQQLFGILRYELRMSGPRNMSGKQLCAVVCVSKDAAKTWKFAEVRQGYREELKTMIPGFPDALRIPAVDKMVWTKSKSN